MAKLADYELANLAAWCFDYGMASRLYSTTVEKFREKQDYFGTLGSLEGAIISHQLIPGRWKEPTDRVLQKILGKEEGPLFKLPPLQKKLEDDRAKKFNALVESEQKSIHKRIEHQRTRLRQSSPEFRRHQEKDASTAALSCFEHCSWFIAVQRLSSFCFGRSYRRDGIVPDLNLLLNQFNSENLSSDLIDARFISTTIEEIDVEIWFDGRVYCITAVKEFPRIIPIMQRVADTCDKVIADDH